MKNYKNIIYLLLAIGAIILLSLLTGCKKDTADDYPINNTVSYTGTITWVQFTTDYSFIVKINSKDTIMYREYDHITQQELLPKLGNPIYLDSNYGIDLQNNKGQSLVFIGYPVSGPTK